MSAKSNVDMLLRREGLELAPLLERHEEVSTFQTPLFAAVVHRYPSMLQSSLTAASS